LKPEIVTLLTCFIAFCLGSPPSQAKGITANGDSLLAVRLLTLSEKETDQKKALAYAIKSLSIGSQISNTTIIAKSYRQLGYLYRNERAPQLYELDSLCVQYAARTTDKALHFDAIQLIVKDYLNNNQAAHAEAYLPLLDSLAAGNPSPFNQCVANQVKGFYYFKKFKPAEALAFAQKSLYYASQQKSSLLTARSLCQVGQSFLYLMKHDSAAIYLFKAADELKKINDDFEKGNMFGTLGFLFQLSGDLPGSLGYYKTAHACFEKAGHPIEAAYNDLTVADIYFAQQKTDSAYHSILKALTAFQKHQYRQGLGLSYNSLGRYYGKINNKDSAQYYFGLSKNTLLPLNNPLLSFYTSSYEAVNAFKAGDFKKGDSMIKKEYSQIHNTFPHELLNGAVDKVAMPGLRDTQKKELRHVLLTGDTSKLVVDSNMINPFTGTIPQLDSLISLKQQEKIARIEAQYKVKEARDSTILANRESQLAKQKLSQRNQALLYSLLILFIILLLLYLQIRNRKTIELLKEEADHRVTNTLTNISSIIDRVKATSADKIAFDVLEEKVGPLMILYRLLSEKKTEEIVLQEYFDIICNGLKTSYDHDNRINIHIDANVTMPGKKAGRTGLIVNELVTNSFKHAFMDQSTGSIAVVCKNVPGNKYYLSVSDSGTGNAPTKSSQRGLQQVKALAWELSATIKEKKENGVSFEFYFI
jgi:two-component sensor histidine kinase